MAETFPFTPVLPVGSVGRRSSGYWGMVFLVISEASVFAYLFFAYAYFATQTHSAPWPPGGPPELRYAIPQTVLLLLSAGSMWWSERAMGRGARFGSVVALGVTALLGAGFIVLQFIDWFDKPFSLATDPYGSLYFTITGVHLAHLVFGVIMLLAVLVWSVLGYFGPVRHAPVMVTALYWYFIVVAWLALFFTIYMTPYM
jgi:cytochrome c oxidase subunit III